MFIKVDQGILLTILIAPEKPVKPEEKSVGVTSETIQQGPLRLEEKEAKSAADQQQRMSNNESACLPWTGTKIIIGV